MMTKKILIAALLSCAFAPALAEEMGGAEERVERRIVIRQGDGHPGPLEELHNLHGGPGVFVIEGRVVKNAPYSAEAVHERVRQLADGNQIVNKTSTMYYRDSAGRTRIERRDDDGQVRAVTIFDPVEGTRWLLRPDKKTATKATVPGEEARAAAAQARAAAAQAREHARTASAEARAAAEQARAHARAHIEELRKEGKLPEDARIIVKEAERSGDGKEVRIRIAQPGSLTVMPRDLPMHLGPMIAGAMGDAKWSSKAVAKDLGSRDISGVKAQGRQRSYEIPAGEIGNRNPINVSTETWTSPDLKIMVYHKHSDPRSGEVVYRLENLKREEPAAALFTVPSDYTVKDAMSTAKRVVKKAD